jgi:hypothetical protein
MKYRKNGKWIFINETIEDFSQDFDLNLKIKSMGNTWERENKKSLDLIETTITPFDKNTIMITLGCAIS